MYNVYLKVKNNPSSSVCSLRWKTDKISGSQVTIRPVDAFMQSCMFQLKPGKVNLYRTDTERGGERTSRDKLSIIQTETHTDRHATTAT